MSNKVNPDKHLAGGEKHGSGTLKLELNGVSRTFGSVRALLPTSLNVRDGEFVVILGPSGSGKSTLLKLVAGFDHPTGGTISIDGYDVTQVPAYKRNIGMVFQNYALFPHLDVFQNIAFPLSVRGEKRSSIRGKVDQMLNLVGLSSFGTRTISSLSGGQQQRIALARGLVFNPNLLLLDEPLSALDKQLREQMQFELRRIHRRVGTTFIGVTHDQREAMIMADRVVVMNDGQIEQIGTPEAVYDRPNNLFVASFVGDASILPGILARWQPETTPWGEQTCSVTIPELGEFNGVLNNTPPTNGSDVSLVIRPEKVLIDTGQEVPNDVRTWNLVTGKVAESDFTGEFLDIIVTKGGGTTLRAKVPRVAIADVSKVSEGSDVRLRWKVEDTVVLAGIP